MISTINPKNPKTANKATFKDSRLFGDLLSGSKSKSQRLLSKSATYHKKCIQD
jgi:hypothetical protein